MQKKCKYCGKKYETKSNTKTCGKKECKDKLYKERRERRYEKTRTGKPTGRPRKQHEEHIYTPKESDTKCWSCQKATSGCNWSDRLKPVEGWNVEITIIQHKVKGKI